MHVFFDIQHERSTYNILLKQLGEEDSRTKDSANWIKTFQIRDLQVVLNSVLRIAGMLYFTRCSSVDNQSNITFFVLLWREHC